MRIKIRIQIEAVCLSGDQHASPPREVDFRTKDFLRYLFWWLVLRRTVLVGTDDENCVTSIHPLDRNPQFRMDIRRGEPIGWNDFYQRLPHHRVNSCTEIAVPEGATMKTTDEALRDAGYKVPTEPK